VRQTKLIGIYTAFKQHFMRTALSEGSSPYYVMQTPLNALTPMLTSPPLIPSFSAPLPIVAVAILYQEDRYLLQLRDNIPGIVYPDHWGFFGGHLEAGESPEQALLRELIEEIGYQPPAVYPFRTYETEISVRHVFHAPLLGSTDRLVLGEGADFKLVSVPEIEAGEAYSEVLGQLKPLGNAHRQILLDFIAAP